MKSAEKQSQAAYYIKPLNVILDVATVAATGLVLFSGLAVNVLHLMAYLAASWLITGYFSRYYEVYRYTGTLQFLLKVIKQALFFMLCVAGFFLFVKRARFDAESLMVYAGITLAICTLFKVLAYAFIKAVPVHAAGRFIAIGVRQDAATLTRALKNGSLAGIFPSGNGGNFVEEALQFANSTPVDTIFCSLAQVTQTQKEALEAFALKTGTALKFIPDTTEWFSKNLYIDYHEDFPVLAVQKTALHNPVAAFAKRIFDVVFSSFVIVFVLSWLTPIIAVFIKLESKGPVFFKQGRPGIDESEFLCYKFRSMGVNRTSEAMAVKNDMRVTKTGKFLRKTSLDELPQFINVFKGEMSVVGPRPQIWFHNNEYKKRINNFSVRLYVKPGITGLAQVSGYRGEINTDAEMQNRIRYDVFYIKQWSMLFDIRIIIQTVVNIFMGEEKAY